MQMHTVTNFSEKVPNFMYFARRMRTDSFNSTSRNKIIRLIEVRAIRTDPIRQKPCKHIPYRPKA